MPETSNGLMNVSGVAVDSAGDIYIADAVGGQVVMETLQPDGSYVQSLVANTGLTSPARVAVDASGNVYVADANDGKVFKETLAGGVYSQSQILNTQGGIAGISLDASNDLYIADSGGDRILKETPSGSTYTQTVVINQANDPNEYLLPVAVAAGAGTSVYFINGNGNVEESTLANGSYTTTILTSVGTETNSGSSGETTSAGLGVDATGNLYIADNAHNRILKATLNNDGTYTTTTISVIPGSTPTGIAVGVNGTVYSADYGHVSVDLHKPNTIFSATTVGSTSGTISLTAIFDTGGTLAGTTPYQVLTQGAASLAFNAAATQASSACISGHTYNAGDTCTVGVTFSPKLTGPRYGAVVLSSSAGPIATGYATGAGTGPQLLFAPLAQTTLGSGFTKPSTTAVDGNGNLYVADSGNSAIKEIPAGCTASSCIVTLGGGFNGATGVAVDGAGNLFVGDTGNNAVKTMSPSCTSSACVTTLGGGFSAPVGIAVDGSGAVYVADEQNNAVKKISPGCASANCVTTLGGGFNEPTGVALDGNGNVYVADWMNSAVKEMPTTCGSASCVTTINGGFSSPTAVAVDSGGNLFVSNTTANSIQEMPAGCSTSSCVTTFFSGFTTPYGVSVDAADNVYVCDYNNNAVRKLDRADAPSLSFASTGVGLTSSDSPQTVTLTNVGSAALTFPVPSSGNNPSVSSSFTLNSTGTGTCSVTAGGTATAGTLAEGASCTLPISFTPAATGAITGTLALTDTNLNASPNATQTIALSGTAVTGPSFTVTGLVSAVAGTVQTITVTAMNSQGINTAYAGAVHFTSTDPSAVLPMNYTFVPADAGVHTFSVTLNTFGSRSVTVTDTVSAITASESAAVTVNFAITLPAGVNNMPPTTPAGAPMQFTVAAEDANGKVVTSYTDLVSFTSSDSQATFPANPPLTAGSGSFSATFNTQGNQTITVTDPSNTTLRATSAVVHVLPPNFVVTTSFDTDDPGVASKCTIQLQANSGTDAACTLRAALAASVTAGGYITFDITKFATPATIVLTTDTLSVPSNTTIQGPTITVSGVTLNLITVSGNNAVTVFTIGSGVSSTAPAAIANLNITQGAQSVVTPGNEAAGEVDEYGGGINNAGSLSITGSVISGNTCSPTSTAPYLTVNGCGIFNTGTLTVTASAVLNNTCAPTSSTQQATLYVNGCGIDNAGTLTLTRSAISYNNCNVSSSGSLGQVNVYGCGLNAGSLIPQALSDIVIVDTTAVFNNSCTASANAYAYIVGCGVNNEGGERAELALQIDSGMAFTGVTISGNTGTATGSTTHVEGGGVANEGVIAMRDSTISGNSADDGAGLFNLFNATVIGSTISLNTASKDGGSIEDGEDNSGANETQLQNSIVSGNIVPASGSDYFNTAASASLPVSYIDNGGNLVGNASIQLSALGSYGGPTLTMVPLLGSPAICAGTIANIVGLPTDQRGGPRTTTYPATSSSSSPTTCVDSGAVQTDYALNFFQQPTNVVKGTAMVPAPSIVVTESGQGYLGGPVTIPLNLTGPGALSGGSATTPSNCNTIVNCNLATYTNLSINTAATGDVLSASYPVGSAASGPSITAVSNPFSVTTAVTQLGFGVLPAASIMPGGNAGNAITVQEETPSGSVYASGTDTITLSVTGPGQYAMSYTATAAAGVATFDLSSAALSTAGNYSYTASLAGVTSATATTTVAALDFTFTESTTFQTVVPGSSTTFTYTTTPMGGTYPGTVTFAVSGLPAGATGTFSPNTVAVSDGTKTITLTVQTTKATTTSQRREGRLPLWSLALLVLPLAAGRSLRRSARGLGKALLIAVVLLSSAGALLGISACGSSVGGGFQSAPPKNYILTVTATSGTVVHTQTATLNLQ